MAEDSTVSSPAGNDVRTNGATATSVASDAPPTSECAVICNSPPSSSVTKTSGANSPPPISSQSSEGNSSNASTSSSGVNSSSAATGSSNCAPSSTGASCNGNIDSEDQIPLLNSSSRHPSSQIQNNESNKSYESESKSLGVDDQVNGDIASSGSDTGAACDTPLEHLYASVISSKGSSLNASNVSSEKFENLNGEVKILRPPSPIPGPSSKSDVSDGDKCGNVTTRLRLENERLKREVSELKRLVSASGLPNDSLAGASVTSNSPPPGASSKVSSLEQELMQAKETILTLKADRKRLKAEKCDLVNQMKQLYATLEDKEKELRDFIRSFEQKMRDSEDCLSAERADRERERWSLLKQARDEAERSLSLAAQLDLKQQQLLDARCQLSAGGCHSDQESTVGGAGGSGWRGVINGGDRTSGSVDSGLRGSSDRQSTTNLSDSTADAITTPKECSSPSLSPLNAHSFSRSLDSSTLSRSVEQLSSPQAELEPLRRGKLRGSGGSSTSSSGGGGGGGGGGATKSTWGSISRVFARSRHRNKLASPGSQDESNSELYGRSWSPLTEEGYTEKLRLLREASSVPMERWRAPTVLAWLEISLGMPQYGPRCAQNIKSGKVLLELSDVELEVGLGIQHPMHRKKLRLAIEEHRHPTMVRYPSIGQLGHTWVASEWLPDLGLAQYSENFATNLVDARMLDHLSKKELEKYLGVTRKFHQASIVHGIHLLRMMKFDRQALAVRRHQCESVDTDPLVWTNQRFIRWVRNIDLGEYGENLKDSGVHGALVVLEPSFNGDTMATALGIPPSRNMIRRHLAAELEALVLPARAGFEGAYAVSSSIRRSSQVSGGSLGRSLAKIQGRALPPPPLPPFAPSSVANRNSDRISPTARRATSFRGSLSKAFGSRKRRDQGISSGGGSDRECERRTIRDGCMSSGDNQLSPGFGSGGGGLSPTWSDDGSLMLLRRRPGSLLRPDSPQSVASSISVASSKSHRHRRVKSIGDIDTIRTVTPV